MKFFKKNTINILIAFFILVLSLSVVFISFYFSPNNSLFNINNTNFKNVILFIGDGMGPNHIKTTELYNGYNLYLTSNATFKTKVTTHSLNSDVTDSAAAATALSTGIKTNNNSVAKLNNENLENMAEYAKKLNKGVGIISTETLTGATPASFSGHAKHRYDIDDIFTSQLNSDVDIFISAGKDFCNTKLEEIENSDASYITSLSELETVTQNKQNKIIASFNSIPCSNFNDENPNLAKLCQIAINYLTNCYGENGFFLMIEEAHIDKQSHSNNIFNMIDRTNNLDNTVRVVNDWAKQNNTCVFVTADHETGNLQYLPNTQINNNWFFSSSHTGTNVDLFCYSQNYNWIFNNNKTIDNTDIAKIIRNLLK